MFKEREKEMKTILRVLSLSDGEGGDSLTETGKFKKRDGFREEMIRLLLYRKTLGCLQGVCVELASRQVEIQKFQ